MKFAIITHVQHIKNDSQYFGYAPYIREMNIWLQHVGEVIVVAPLVNKELNPIHEKYCHSKLRFLTVSEFNITSAANFFKALFKLPKVFSTVYLAMSQADHIHLRCPGNMGLIGALVQILFPNKQKTAKYAGNWDPHAKQPLSYRIQKWILSNTFLTKNMQVLVYGDWENQTKNIKPFFTATYSQNEIGPIIPRNFEGEIKFLFAGTLSEGKRPLYAIQLVQELHKKGIKAQLDICGEGYLKQQLQQYISQNNLSNFVFLKGNRSKEDLLQAYQKAHFLILASKSEGWPKVVAEAMFWGCVPLATNISCVNNMIDHENRGVLLTLDVEEDAQKVLDLLDHPSLYQQKAEKAVSWSQQYTTEKFENEIKKILI